MCQESSFVNVGNKPTRKTPHTNEEEVLSGFKTTARDVLSTI